MKHRTVVKINLPVVDENGDFEMDGENPKTEEVMFYLLHWGLHMEIIADLKNDQKYPVSYTVGICQHIKNGTIKIFAPEEITVIGFEQK